MVDTGSCGRTFDLWLSRVNRLVSNRAVQSCGRDPCPFWLIKAARVGQGEWVKGTVNNSLRWNRVPVCLKEAIGRALFRKPSLNSTILENCHPVINMWFLGNMSEIVGASQFQGLLGRTTYLDQSPHFRVSLRNGDHFGHFGRWSMLGTGSFLVLLEFSVTFSTVEHDNLLGHFSGMRLGTVLFVTSCLDCCNALYVGWPLTTGTEKHTARWYWK